MVFVAFIFLFLLLSVRLLHLKFSSSSLGKRAEKSQRIEEIILAPRGEIRDRNGEVLSLSLPVKSIFAETRNVKDIEKVASLLSSILSISEKRLKEKLKEEKDFVWIKRKITQEEYERVKGLNLQGVCFKDEFLRRYPEGKLACHILGFTDMDGKGLEGIELYYDSSLKGKDGKRKFLRDARGEIISTFYTSEKKPEPGHNLILSLDKKIQDIAEEEIEEGYQKFEAKAVCALVMDSESGEILALANRPNFNPNSPADFPVSSRRNRIITDLFEPGSIFKIVTAAACLQEKVIRPEETIFCENGKWKIRNHILHDHKPYKELSFSDVIIKSSNIGTVKAALLLGEEKLYRYCRLFGFGERTGIDLPGEVRGILRPVKEWSGYSITAIPIGQEVAVTPVQALAAMNVLGNGGRMVQPHLLKKVQDENGERKVIAPEISKTLCEILKGVVSEEGTAPLAEIPGYLVIGKTGTAQKVFNGHYSHSKFVASFVGIISTGKKRLAIFVMIDEPKLLHYGGLVAAPVFSKIGKRILAYLQIPPKRQNTVASSQ